MSKVIITGSGRRLGRGLALEFAKKGWDVIVHYNNSKESAEKTVQEIQNLGVNCIAFQADVRNINELEEGFNKVVDEFGYPDVLVNNAGMYPEMHHLDTLSMELWHKILDINLTGYLAMAKMFTANAKVGSHIVNIASMGAFKIWKGRIPYNVSKAGVIQLTKALAFDLAPNFVVNSVSPGSIDIPNDAPSEKLRVEDLKIPMGRYGTVQDVFDAVHYFANSSLYITGQNINIDGGYDL